MIYTKTGYFLNFKSMGCENFLGRINLKFVAFAIILATCIYTLFFAFLQIQKLDGYILGDWLINFQDGGFKRRGLTGSFFFLLQDLTGLTLNVLVLIFVSLLIGSFFFIYFKIIKNRKIDLLYISLMLSTIGFVGLFNCVGFAGKKEFVIFFLFAMFVYWLINNEMSKTREWVIVFGLFVAMFIHEVTLFYVPYFFIALYIKSGKFEFFRYFKFIIAVLVPAALIIVFGKEINEGQSLAILKERGIYFNRGIFFWNIDEKEYLIKQINGYRWYFLSLAISVFHIWFYIKSEKINKLIGWLLVGAFLFTLPLFVIAIDWGRWIYIHMMLIIIMFPMLIKESKSIWEYVAIKFDRLHLITFVIILFSLTYRVEILDNGFTFEGLFYRVFVAPFELIHKMI